MNNTMQILNLLKGNINPKEMVLNMMGVNNNQMIKNLLEMAEKGKTEDLMNFGRNLYKQKGLNFDEEYSKFIKNIK